MKTGIELIAEERARQIAEEGYTASDDDKHVNETLPQAAASYALYAASLPETAQELWPWEIEWYKPSEDPIRNLVKAGALIAAEIDRLQRLNQSEQHDA